MKRLFVGGILAASCGALLLPPGPALLAQATSPAWYTINVVRVKPERLTDWLDLQRRETIPALQKIGVVERSGWASVYGDGFEFFFATPMAKMAERDQPQGPFVRALGEEGARIYNQKVRGMIESTLTLAIQPLPDVSIVPPASFTPKLAILTFSYVAPGRAAEYETYLSAEVMPAIRKAQPVGYVQSRTVFGGDATEYVSLRYIDTFAEIDQGPLIRRAVGEPAAAKINAKSAGLVTRQERRIYRFVPDLSFRPKTTS